MPTTRKPQPPKERAKLIIPRAEFDQQLTDRIDSGKALLDIEMKTTSAYEEVQEKYRRWDTYNATLIESAFTTSEEADTYKWWGMAFSADNLWERIAYLTKDIKEKILRLESLKERLNLFPEVPVLEPPSQPTIVAAAEQAVFIVHGRDEGPRRAISSKRMSWSSLSHTSSRPSKRFGAPIFPPPRDNLGTRLTDPTSKRRFRLACDLRTPGPVAARRWELAILQPAGAFSLLPGFRGSRLPGRQPACRSVVSTWQESADAKVASGGSPGNEEAAP